MGKGEWKERTARFVRFEKEGDTVEGVLTSIGQVEIRGEPINRYIFETQEGNVAFLGSVQLDSLITTDDVGAIMRVIYQAREKTAQGYQVKLFKVYQLDG